ncbi:MAG: alkaline phosphatase family protein [Candidatus Binataceae bacterium]|nr:alkaline phosphatase family protein [Candidatus Binataceae bacterium]
MPKASGVCLRAISRIAAVLLLIAMVCGQPACSLLRQVENGEGQHTLRTDVTVPRHAPRVILFAVDGVGYGQVRDAIHSGKAPHLETLLGKTQGAGVFEHGYSVPDVTTIMPSCSTAGWASIVTGRPPAQTGVAGDEFFVRDQTRFYAPIPLSTRDSSDFSAAVDHDLLGKILRVPTVYQRIEGSSDVSLLYVYHGATIYSTLGSEALVRVVGDVITGKFTGETLRQSLAAPVDDGSTAEVLDVIRQHGTPSLLVVYLPGPDIYAHGSPYPLRSQTEYLENNVDRNVGAVLSAYAKDGLLDDTYVLFTADHGHTPVLNDRHHDLDAGGSGALSRLLSTTGFRVREPGVKLPADKQDYQAVIADEGFSAYLYLADRSTCRKPGTRCDWRKPPRFKEDILPVLRALDGSTRAGDPLPVLKNTIDLIFSRKYSGQTTANAPPFEIFDGERLVPVPDYLSAHPRSNFIQVDRRMRWLGEGPYGDRAGDIVVLAKAGLSLPLEDRYYFSTATYYAWHGSLTLQDSHIPLIVAKTNASGGEIKGMVDKIVGDQPSALDVTSLIESLLEPRMVTTGRESCGKTAATADRSNCVQPKAR